MTLTFIPSQQDSFTLTRLVEYLWIDSLCIIQDSIQDWARESSMMEKVYQHAICTISADCAVGSSTGFLHGMWFSKAAYRVEPCLISIPKMEKLWLHNSPGDFINIPALFIELL
jgi:hypothetical protein